MHLIHRPLPGRKEGFSLKYKFDDRLAAVKLYLERQIYCYPADAVTKSKRHSYSRSVQLWASRYLLDGEEGLKHKGHKIRSAEEKLELIEPCLKQEVSIKLQSTMSGINTGTLFAWIKAYNEYGIHGLECKPGRMTKPMPEHKKELGRENPAATEPKDAEIERLKKELDAEKHQNILLRFELEYTKKVRALEEEEKRRESGRKRSIRSSKAEDSKGK
jgi:transposase-like protein